MKKFLAILLLAFLSSTAHAQLSSNWTIIDRMGDTSNSDAECYKPANVTVVSGNAVITSKPQSVSCSDTNLNGSLRNGPTGFSYTSGAFQQTSLNYTFGEVDVRAQFAANTWPTIWFFGNNCQVSNPHTADNIASGCQWPISGSEELDILECDQCGQVGMQVKQNLLSGSAPNVKDQGCVNDVTATAPNPTTGFHVYSVVWTSGNLVWSIDGTQTATCTNHVPTQAMFVNVTVEIGGTSGGTPPSGSVTTQIDYVKICSAACNGGNTVFFDDFVSTLPPTALVATSLAVKPPYQVALSWTASATPSVNYNIYRTLATAPYTCPAAGAWPLISSGSSSLALTDSSIGPGFWCYQVTATNGTESVPTSPAVVIVPAQAIVF